MLQSRWDVYKFGYMIFDRGITLPILIILKYTRELFLKKIVYCLW